MKKSHRPQWKRDKGRIVNLLETQRGIKFISHQMETIYGKVLIDVCELNTYPIPQCLKCGGVERKPTDTIAVKREVLQEIYDGLYRSQPNSSFDLTYYARALNYASNLLKGRDNQ